MKLSHKVFLQDLKAVSGHRNKNVICNRKMQQELLNAY